MQPEYIALLLLSLLLIAWGIVYVFGVGTETAVWLTTVIFGLLEKVAVVL